MAEEDEERDRLAELRERAREARAERAPDPEFSDLDDIFGDEQAPELGDINESRRTRILRKLKGLSVPGRPKLPGRPKSEPQGDVGEEKSSPGDRAKLGAADARDSIALGWHRLRDRWERLPEVARARISAGLLALAALAAFFLLLVPNGPCWLPGGDRCAPSDDAIALVPADTAVYLHLNLQTDSDQYEAAEQLAPRLGDLIGQGSGLLSGLTGQNIDYGAEVAPWSTGEVAIAVAGVGARIERMTLFEIENEEAAVEFADRLRGPATDEEEIGGSALQISRGGTATAVKDDFLLVGDEALVRQTLEPEATLDDEAAADEALDEVSDDAILTGYLSEDFITAFDRDGGFGPARVLFGPEASEGAAISLGVDDESDVIEIQLSSRLDPERSESDPLIALDRFEPSYPGRLDSDALFYLGVGDPSAGLPPIYSGLSGLAPELFGPLQRADRRFQRSEGVSISSSLLPLLGDAEAAVTVQPTLSPGEQLPETSLQVTQPYLSVGSLGLEDGDETAEALGNLEQAFSKAVGGKKFKPKQSGEFEARTMSQWPYGSLTYGVEGDAFVVGTDPVAVERAFAPAEVLSETARYADPHDGIDGDISLLAYLNVERLVQVGNAILADDQTYAALSQLVDPLESAVIAVDARPDLLESDLRVKVGERGDEAAVAPQIGVPVE